jgi:hypothetical protein
MVDMSPMTLIQLKEESKLLYGRNWRGELYKQFGLIYLHDLFGRETLVEILSEGDKRKAKDIRYEMNKSLGKSLKTRQSIQVHSRRSIEYVQEIINQYAKAS